MATETAGPIFTLICQNQSSRSGSFCVFQQDPTLGVSGAQSVAWMVKPAHPTTTVTFKWTTDYDFVWSQTGELTSGIVISSSQVWPADLDTTNQVTFTLIGGAFTFENQTQGSQAGTLYIVEDQTIPADTASVGIGMAEKATFLTQAQPNVTLGFSPNPQIWLVFGDYLDGEVLNVSAMANPVQIVYGNNIYSMTAILNADNTWAVTSTQAVNEALVRAREDDPRARWGDSVSAS